MKCLVTGGGGMLGSGIVRRLLDRGDKVRSLSRSEYPKLKQWGVEQIQGDISDAGAVDKACDGVELVFHVAGKAGVWGSTKSFRNTNFVGTENVIQGCLNHKVRKLVYTSSPSVVFNGKDMEGVNESVPYAEHYLADYPRTKAIAERMVLAINGRELATVALRPHLIWGPGDQQLVPRIIQRAKEGKLRQVGDGNNRIDSIYIDNCVDAHLLAAEHLEIGSNVAGKAYFLSNDEPWLAKDLINGILAAAKLPPMDKTISLPMARLAGVVCETVYGLLGISKEPPMTRFLADELATSHWFNISAAKNDLGYRPKVSIKEGLARLADSLS